MPTKKTLPEKQSNSARRLYRSESGKMIAGVCAGLAHYFDIDPSIVRLVFVLSIMLNGAGIIGYLVLWVILPTPDQINQNPEETVRKNVADLKSAAQSLAVRNQPDRSRLMFGAVLIGVGVMILLKNLGIWDVVDLTKFWPVALILLGLVALVR